MPNVDEMIDRVAKESNKSIEDIKAKMGERKKKTHGLLSDYGAIYAVAKEYGIDLNQDSIVVTKIKQLKPKTGVNVCGKVKMVYSPREFTRKDGSKGKFASVILVDDSGETRLVLWDNNAEITKRLHVGNTLMIRNCYVKDNNGVIEIHAGPLTNITINPVIDFELPEVEENLVKINDLREDMSSVNTVCRVTSYYARTEFQRSDGSIGARASFIGEDENGKIRVVLWDRTSEIQIKDGDFVKIENGYMRKGLNDELELQTGSRSRVIKTDRTLDLPPLPEKEKEIKISDVKSGIRGISLSARVLRVYQPRDYSGGKMASLIIGDETGTIRTVLWNEKSEIVTGLKEGDAIEIQNAYSKGNMNDEPEIHIGKYGSLAPAEESELPPMDDIKKSITVDKNIADLEINDRHVRITASIADVDDTRALFYMTCPGCNKKVQNLGETWFCESCGDIDPVANMMVSFIIEDDTGNVRAISFRENAERVLGMSMEEAMNLIGKTQDENAPLRQAKEKIAGKKISVVGRVRYNEFSDQLDFMVDEVS